MIDAILPIGTTAPAPISEQATSRIRADSLTIANLYGFAPALFVAQTAPLIYTAINRAPDAVSAVPKVVRTQPVGYHRPGEVFDLYA